MDTRQIRKRSPEIPPAETPRPKANAPSTIGSPLPSSNINPVESSVSCGVPARYPKQTQFRTQSELLPEETIPRAGSKNV